MEAWAAHSKPKSTEVPPAAITAQRSTELCRHREFNVRFNNKNAFCSLLCHFQWSISAIIQKLIVQSLCTQILQHRLNALHATMKCHLMVP